MLKCVKGVQVARSSKRYVRKREIGKITDKNIIVIVDFGFVIRWEL